MPHKASDTSTRGDIFTYSTCSVFGPGGDPAEGEVIHTLAELIESFGAQTVVAALLQTSLAPRLGATDDKVQQALRASSSLIQESRWPKLDAILIGRLARMELVCGERVKLDDLGRTYGGQTKAAVSKRLNEIAERLGLPNPESTESARESHRLMNRSNARL